VTQVFVILVKITGMPAAGCSLWPANGKLVTVATVSALSGLTTPSAFDVTGVSNEPANPGPDIVITGSGMQPRTVQLRAERSGGGDGRVYTITAAASNVNGDVNTAVATCAVPHDQGH
jgi:hypothetical protein